VSALGDAIAAIKEALRLADDVKRAGNAIREIAVEVREHDRRITRLEAQWETAMALSGQRRLEDKS
jgi:hypothetical protein